MAGRKALTKMFHLHEGFTFAYDVCEGEQPANLF